MRYSREVFSVSCDRSLSKRCENWLKIEGTQSGDFESVEETNEALIDAGWVWDEGLYTCYACLKCKAGEGV